MLKTGHQGQLVVTGASGLGQCSGFVGRRGVSTTVSCFMISGTMHQVILHGLISNCGLGLAGIRHGAKQNFSSGK